MLSAYQGFDHKNQKIFSPTKNCERGFRHFIDPEIYMNTLSE